MGERLNPAGEQDSAGSTPAPADGDADPVRARLLDAAARVFARQGYDGTRILDIVREAGLSTGAVYGRFRSKDDLLREAVIARSVGAARLSDDGAERVADLVARIATRSSAPLSDAEAVRLEAFLAARREPEIALALGEADLRWRDSVVPLVQAALVDGTIGEGIDPDAVLYLVRTLHLGLLVQRGSGLPGPDPVAWEHLVSRVVASFGRPDGTPAEPSRRPPTAPPRSQREGKTT